MGKARCKYIVYGRLYTIMTEFTMRFKIIVLTVALLSFNSLFYAFSQGEAVKAADIKQQYEDLKKQYESVVRDRDNILSQTKYLIQHKKDKEVLEKEVQSLQSTIAILKQKNQSLNLKVKELAAKSKVPCKEECFWGRFRERFAGFFSRLRGN